MHADLMRAPGVEVTAQECMCAALLDDRVPSARIPTACHHRHALAIFRVATYRAFELARVGVEAPARDRQVGAAQRPIAQLRAQGVVAGVVARHADQTRGAFVEPVDDPGTSFTARRRPASTATQQRMDQRPRLVARGGMDDHARRLVDDDQVFILIHDLEQDRFRRGGRRIGLGDIDLDHVADRHVIRGIRGLPVDTHQVALDEACGGGAAQVARVLGDESVEPGSRGLGDQPAVGFRKKYPAMSRTTPMLTAESATLKTGQKWKLMKSVTPPPLMIRSKALPNAPPRMSPSTASTPRSAGWRTT